MSKKEATIILLDVGQSTSALSGKNGISFFERAKTCVSKIIQKKIFAKPNDEVALLLMGCDETKNDLNDTMNGFENITEKISLQMPNWEMIRELDKVERGNSKSDWVDGLVVAVNFAKNETQAKKFGNVRILLLTNFASEVNEDNMDVIVNAVKESNFDLLVISDCVEHTDQLKSSQFSQNLQSSVDLKSQQLIENVIEETGGFLCNVEMAESQLLFFQKKQNRAMPWNATLTIGSKFQIDVSSYVSVQDEKFLASFKIESNVENTVTKMFTEYEINNQATSRPDPLDIVNGYVYGSELVVVDHTEYKDTEKCLACLGFTKRSKILNEYLAGDSSHIVLPQKNRTKSPLLFASLVEALMSRDEVMIARKVYRNGLKPVIVVLIPDVRNEVPFFTLIQLPFANDFALYSFPKLRTKKTEPTNEQELAIKELVDAMDLMDAVDDGSGITEAFALETSLNPVNQHLCRSVAFRALHPSDPLPTIDPELVAMIDVPPKVKEASAEVLKKVEELFPLEMIERPVKKVFGSKKNDPVTTEDAMEVDSIEMSEGKTVIAIGTVTPAEDFGYLLKQGERFGVLAEQMQTVIYDLIFRTASTQKEKILESIMMYREQSKLYGPFAYNNWIKELKKVIIQRNRLDFWQDSIVKEGFGLISNNEAPISTVTIEEQREFFEVATKDSHKPVASNYDDDDDLDALLDL